MEEQQGPRLFVPEGLATGAQVVLAEKAAHYLLTVLRLDEGHPVLVFNGRNGEWFCRLQKRSRKTAVLLVERQTQQQPLVPDLWFAFAPLKTARLDYLVQKAVEMGASDVFPVFTDRTQGRFFNTDKALANMIEAAEQCDILSLPELHEANKLMLFLDRFPAGRQLVFCDEAARMESPIAALQALAKDQPLAVLIGPEGGFSDAERQRVIGMPNICRLSLGPRILRADTAAVAAMTLVQSVLGDWTGLRPPAARP